MNLCSVDMTMGAAARGVVGEGCAGTRPGLAGGEAALGGGEEYVRRWKVDDGGKGLDSIATVNWGD